MKANSIIIGNLYEVKAGRNVTVVKVKSVNKKTGCWICETTKGKKMNIADAARFVKDVTPEKEAKKEKAAPVQEKNDREKSDAQGGHQVESRRDHSERTPGHQHDARP